MSVEDSPSSSQNINRIEEQAHTSPVSSASIHNDTQRDPGPDASTGGALGSISPASKAWGKQRATDDQPNTSTVIRLTDPNVQLQDPDTDDDEPITAGLLASELAPEILVRVFSFLDPVSLARAAAVCHPWARVARDDATWRAAFATFYSLEAADPGHSSSHAVPSFRRLSPASWKSEFQQRSELLRRWRKSRAPTTLSNPKLAVIDQISISKQHTFMISASEFYGVASRSNPFTGKVVKGYLDAEGTANGAGNGNPNLEFSPHVTALAMGADASMLAWGFRSGEISLTTLSRQGSNPRGAIKSHKFSPRGSHAGPVLGIALPFSSDHNSVHGPGRSPDRLRQQLASLGDVATTFVTVGHDGTVRLWSSLRALPLWVASTSTAPAPNASQTASAAAGSNQAQVASPICVVDYDARAGIIAAGTASGKVFVWHNIAIADMLAVPAEATDPEMLQNHEPDKEPSPDLIQAQRQFVDLVKSVRCETIELPAGTGSETALSHLRIDASPAAPTFSVLALHSGARVFVRHTIQRDEAAVAPAPVVTTVFGAPIVDEITAIRPDFEPRQPQHRSTGPSPLARSPIMSGTAWRDSVPALVLGPSLHQLTGPGQYPERKFVCIGTATGSIYLFDWEAEGVASDGADWQGRWGQPATASVSMQVQPSVVLHAHTAAITALEITMLHIIAGTSDGAIKVLCALSGDVVRVINDRAATRLAARMLATGELSESRYRVTQIIADHECLVASVGPQVLAFRAEPLLRRKGGSGAGAGSKGKRGPRMSETKHQMHADLLDSQAELAREREERQAEHARLRAQTRDFELGDLTEAEAFEYALMLSKDEAADPEARQAQDAFAHLSFSPSSSIQDWPSPSPASAPSQPTGARSVSPSLRPNTEDDDLRFAIELSLAEEQSRQTHK